ncbi:MAG: M20/M25/M40 family metallo-hydrolase [Gemmatimonadales bacterium]|nr:M20/M25/M40 family metallo-hydrolase [Gemmatimonadales bacterium]
MSRFVRPALALAALALVAPRAHAQRPGQEPAWKPVPQALPIPAESLPAWVRKTAPADPVIQRIWDEGMQRSQVTRLSQELMDGVGGRLTGSPAGVQASEWAQRQYRGWGVTARAERYGTWLGWERGVSHIDLVAPRVKTLEGMTLAWSPGTNGKDVEAEVIMVPEVGTPEQFQAWLPQAKGKFVLTSAPQLSCRSPQQWAEFGTPASQAAMKAAQDTLRASWAQRLVAAVDIHAKLDGIRARGAFSMQFSNYPGINKIFGTPRQKVPTMDLSCEDYGLLYRLVERGEKPRVRIRATSRLTGEQPVWNTIAELPGGAKRDEYVVLSAHFDSWTAASGATDNGTGTITMMEAMRILKAVLPNPTRTILVGHWNGEEQGLNGSRAFAEDHPEVVAGLQALFNQDNGTGRIAGMGPGPFPKAAPVLQRYLGEVPAELTQYIRFGPPSGPAGGGSDHAGFQCLGAPAFSLGALSWDYPWTTWHTNRDTYDKVVLDDLRGNAVLVAMLAYLASEDPERMPREKLDPLPADPRTGKSPAWPECAKAMRSVAEYKR